MTDERRDTTLHPELAYWRGAIEERVDEVRRRVAGVEDDVAAIKNMLSAVREDMATLRAKVGFTSAIGSLVGAGIVSVVVKLVSG